MECKGHVEGGVVVLEPGSILKEGLEVRIVAMDAEESLPTLAERFKSISGKAEGLPSDLAEKHDYYLHGSVLRPGS